MFVFRSFSCFRLGEHTIFFFFFSTALLGMFARITANNGLQKALHVFVYKKPNAQKKKKRYFFSLPWEIKFMCSQATEAFRFRATKIPGSHEENKNVEWQSFACIRATQYQNNGYFRLFACLFSSFLLYAPSTDENNILHLRKQSERERNNENIENCTRQIFTHNCLWIFNRKICKIQSRKSSTIENRKKNK